MEYYRYIITFFNRIKWWILILPLFLGIITAYMTKDTEKIYDVKTTIYTGIITGYNVDASDTKNASVHLNNLINIITTERTLRIVSLKLLTKCLIYGNIDEDTNYITAKHYKELYKNVPRELLQLVNKKNEDKTYNNLVNYERPSENNFIYQILNYDHPYFSVSQLSEKIKVDQLRNSDMIEISYSANDPGITYNTLNILNEEFVKQYRELRYSETNNVIIFFKKELNRLGIQLTTAEDSLIDYNIKNRIINYDEQTKQVTILDAYQQLDDKDLLVDHTTSSSLIKFYENKLGDYSNLLHSNNEFIDNLNKLSKYNTDLYNKEILSKGSLDLEKSRVNNAERNIRNIAKKISEKSISKDNISYETLINQWLDQVVLNEKTKAHTKAQEIMREKINNDFLYYSPIGATIKRKERNIGFVEKNYLSIMEALNQAILRQKNLEMTAATLKIMNPPLFPLSSSSSGNLIIILSVFLGSLLFIIGYFLIIEILDRTLRDKIRVKRFIGNIEVIGAYPKKSNLRYRRYNKVINDIAIKQISTKILPYINGKEKRIINIISTEKNEGKTHLIQMLENYWISIGLDVRSISHNKDFISDSSKYVEAKSINDICDNIDIKDILLIEYPELINNPFPSSLLNDASINILVIRCDKAWKSIDQEIYNRLLKIKNNSEPIVICLMQADRNCLEDFTGQLPPYTSLKNFQYRISQLALTSNFSKND